MGLTVKQRYWALRRNLIEEHKKNVSTKFDLEIEFIRDLTHPSKTGKSPSDPIECPDCGMDISWGDMR